MCAHVFVSIADGFLCPPFNMASSLTQERDLLIYRLVTEGTCVTGIAADECRVNVRTKRNKNTKDFQANEKSERQLRTLTLLAGNCESGNGTNG